MRIIGLNRGLKKTHRAVLNRPAGKWVCRGSAATFSVQGPIPGFPAPLASAFSARFPRKGWVLSEKIRVLLVDDEERFVANLARILTTRGFEVITAGDGWEAVDRYRRERRIDVVVMDVNMPRLDGLEALKRIKAQDPEAEVIVLTGHGSREDGLKAIRLGAFDYLVKPCPFEELVEKILQAREVERIREEPVLWPGNKVRAVLDPGFLRLSPEGRPAQGLALLAEETGRANGPVLFVLDGGDVLQGCITRRDLLREAWKGRSGKGITWDELCRCPECLPNTGLDRIMRRDIMTADPEEGLAEAAQTMRANNLRTMPVVEGGRMIGQVHLRDILAYIERETE